MFRIKEVMELKGVTGAELARRMGVTPQYISGVIRGGSASVKVLANIAAALDVPLSSLFSDYIQDKEQDAALVCPHCGKPVFVSLKAGKDS